LGGRGREISLLLGVVEFGFLKVFSFSHFITPPVNFHQVYDVFYLVLLFSNIGSNY
jgi:hypothetical protein